MIPLYLLAKRNLLPSILLFSLHSLSLSSELYYVCIYPQTLHFFVVSLVFKCYANRIMNFAFLYSLIFYSKLYFKDFQSCSPLIFPTVKYSIEWRYHNLSILLLINTWIISRFALLLLLRITLPWTFFACFLIQGYNNFSRAVILNQGKVVSWETFGNLWIHFWLSQPGEWAEEVEAESWYWLVDRN